MITRIRLSRTRKKRKARIFAGKRLKTMKMYSKIEERVIYYERGAHIYQLVRCMQDDDSDVFVVRDKNDNPLLASVERDAAMTFFLHKCKVAEEEELD
tara:strand:+ start:29 stop:322 length:294 start_codon:yes stop_codon:yes gene_type:complete